MKEITLVDIFEQLGSIQATLKEDRETRRDHEKRIRNLEVFRNMVGGGTAVIAAAFAFLKGH